MDDCPRLVKSPDDFNTALNNLPHPVFSFQLFQCNYLPTPSNGTLFVNRLQTKQL